MSRRVQLIQRHRADPDGSFLEPAIVIYSSSGKAALHHDPENLLLVFAGLLAGGLQQELCNWEINGKPAQLPAQFEALRIIHERETPSFGESAGSAGSTLLLDVCECIHNGQVYWRLSGIHIPPPRPWMAKIGDLFTAAEVLRLAYATIYDSYLRRI